MPVHEKKSLLVFTMAQIRVEVNLRIVLTVDRGRIVANVEIIDLDGNDGNDGGQPGVADQNHQNVNQRPERAGAGQNRNLCNCDCHN